MMTLPVAKAKSLVGLSKTQQAVVDLMAQGWELGYCQSYSNPYCWLQKGGIGMGGTVKPANRTTWSALLDRKIIYKARDGWPTTAYVLTRFGEACASDSKVDPMTVCPNLRKHTRCPSGYGDWHNWAEKKAKTHRVTKCPDCKRFCIWVPKKVKGKS